MVDEDEAESLVQEMAVVLERLQDLFDPFIAETSVELSEPPDISE